MKSKILLLMVGMIFLIGAMGNISAGTPYDGIKYYYPFDESSGTNFDEIVSNLNDITSFNGTLVGQPGILGNALKFDGVDDQANTLTTLNITKNISISFWVNATSWTNPNTIMGVQNGTIYTGFSMENTLYCGNGMSNTPLGFTIETYTH